MTIGTNKSLKDSNRKDDIAFVINNTTFADFRTEAILRLMINGLLLNRKITK